MYVCMTLPFGSGSDACGYVCLWCKLVCPTGVCVPPESAVPNNETTSCLVNVRGEEERCILGVAHQHPARGDAAAAAESPWVSKKGRGTVERRR